MEKIVSLLKKTRESFQDILNKNRVNTNDDLQRRNKQEYVILNLATQEMRSLAPLYAEIRNEVSKEALDSTITNIVDNHLRILEPIMGNLVAMGFAEEDKSHPDEVRINTRGLLMGELVLELQRNKLRRYLYSTIAIVLGIFLASAVLFGFIEIMSKIGEWLGEVSS